MIKPQTQPHPAKYGRDADSFQVGIRLILSAFLTMSLFLPTSTRAVSGLDFRAEFVTLSSARFIKTDQQVPPALQSPGWVTRALPDNWNLSMPDQGGKGWYRLTLNVRTPDDTLWAVYFPYLNMTGNVYINGLLIGSGGRLDEPLSRNWFRPLLFSFPGSLLKPGLNDVYIRLGAYPNDGGGLAEVLIGHARELQPMYERQWAFRILPAIVMFIMMMIVIALIFVLVLLRSGERHYLWLAGAALFSALFSLNFFLRDIPFDRHLWEAMTQFSLGMTTYCMMMFVNRFLNLRMRRLELGCTLYFPLLGLALIAVPEVKQVVIYELWQLGAIALVILMFLLTAGLWWRTREREAMGIALGFALIVLSGVHDWMVSQLHLEYSHLYLQFAPFAVVAIAVGLWLSRLVTALNDYEHLNRNLNRLVEEKNTALSIALKKTQLASAAKTRFFAVASHDLRQPLHSMALFLSGMEDYLRDEKGIYLAGKIRQGIDMLRTMFDQLLDISRFEAGAIEAEKSTFLLTPVLERLKRDYVPNFLEKGIDLRLFTLPCYLYTDPFLLERILRNYLENALNFTEQGGALIGCRQRGNAIRIEVWDTGRGIPKRDLQTIYDEFHQLDHPGREHGKGVGLGLSIVRQISHLLVLEISLCSRPDKGSVFSVEVPVGEPGQPMRLADDSLQTVSRQSLEGRRIWAVDDDESALEGMEVLLETWGCLCRSFSTPQQVSQFMFDEQERPEMIISDLCLQNGRTGLEVISEIRRETGKHIPAILVTGDTSSDGQYDEAPVLHKPVDPPKLCQLMLDLLARPEVK